MDSYGWDKVEREREREREREEGRKNVKVYDK